ncbi:UNVERIFIED_ORG: P22 coat protein Gp5 [Actinomadura viridilutea]|nr:P22 phage major capsid protein family protein [Actinomadura rubrobrunea]
MANSIATATAIADLAVPLLSRTVVLAPTVLRVAQRNYSGTGGTVSVRIRNTRTANVQATPGAALTAVDVAETLVDVVVNHVYDLANLTEHDLTLGLADFGAQILEPQVDSVAARMDQYVADAMNDLAADVTLTAPDADAWLSAILDAGMTLDIQNVPEGGRFVAVSPQVARALIGHPAVLDASASGSPSAFRSAVIGQLAGFTLVKANQLAADSMVAYHQSAFAMASFAPLPASGADSAVVTRDGYALRVVRQYNPSTATEQSLVSVFAGASLLDGNRVVRVVKSA